MGQWYLIDSNVIIDFAATKIPDEGYAFVENIFNSNFYTSVVVRIEVLGFEDTPERLDILEAFLNTAVEIPLSGEISQKTIALRRIYKKLKLGDAIIAATAIVHGLTLVTHNVNDFKKIQELELINPLRIINSPQQSLHLSSH